jgi:sulfur-oxidizing protein SoxX
VVSTCSGAWGPPAWAAAAASGATTIDPVDSTRATPLDGLSGDASRGRALVVDRREGLCLLCHSGPFPEERFQGDLSTNLSGAGSRWTATQLRQRLVDARSLNPDSIMPAYYRTAGLQRVAPAWQGRPVFTAQQVEDVVAFLLTLR